MSTFYDEVELEDMSFDEKNQLYHYPCPCGDRFEISVEELIQGLDEGKCPSCSLIIQVIYDPADFAPIDDDNGIDIGNPIEVI